MPLYNDDLAEPIAALATIFIARFSISTLPRLLRHLHSSDTKAYLHFKLYAAEMLVYSPLLSLSLSLLLSVSWILFHFCISHLLSKLQGHPTYAGTIWVYLYIYIVYICMSRRGQMAADQARCLSHAIVICASDCTQIKVIINICI